jgi:pimeloyl-ACP methyl ester carboxylesterase
MNTTHSKDGTPLAYDRFGKGPALILVNGAMATRTDTTKTAESLGQHFTIFAYDRRGRGKSGDTAPYAVEREVEDLDALITEAGGSVFVFGHSSGAILALEAARLLASTRILKLALYEPPLMTKENHPRLPEDYVTHVNELIATGQRGEAVVYFLTVAIGLPAETVAQMRNAPMWPNLEAVAHTIAYDGALTIDTAIGSPLPLKKWGSIQIPTLVMSGGKSFPFLPEAAQTLTEILPNAQYRHFPEQDHGIKDDILVPTLVEFFLGEVET